MTLSIVDMKKAALDSIIDWAQNNRHYETMQIRVGDFIDMIYGKEPKQTTATSVTIHFSVRTGAAQGLALSIYDKIPEGKFWDVMNAMMDIVSYKSVQQSTSKPNQPNKH